MQSGVALLTQRRKDAEAQRGVSGRGSGHHLVTGNQVLQGPSFPCLLASLRLCVESSLLDTAEIIWQRYFGSNPAALAMSDGMGIRDTRRLSALRSTRYSARFGFRDS